MFFRFIFYVILGYFIIKILRYLMKIFSSSFTKEKTEVHNNSRTTGKIDKKDIIEAKFEEIETKNDSPSDN